MKRRQYLAGLAAVTALAGCSSGGSGSGSGDGGSGDSGSDGGASDDPDGAGGSTGDTEGSTDGGRDGRPAQATPPSDIELPLPESELKRGAGKDQIPAIVDPVFAPSWEDADEISLRLAPKDTVIGVERAGEARAYPLRVLDWHEIVNDTFDGPLLVTYCPLCGSGVTAERTVDGEETRFGVSGLLWNSDLVMYDEKTESLWSQILGKAVRGPKTGTALSLVPSTITTWTEWQDAHPDTEVLLPPPVSGTITDAQPRDYARSPYAGYEDSESIGIGYNDFEDDRLHPKASVIGVTHDGTSKAYPLDAVGKNAVVNDEVAGLPVVVATTEGGSLFAYERTVDGETLTFENAEDGHVRAGGSRWKKATGTAVDGPHEGTQLTRANDRSQMFWFAWADFHPDTELYEG